LTNIKVLGVTRLGVLLTAKSIMFVANVVENGFENDPHLDAVRQRAEEEGGRRSGLRGHRISRVDRNCGADADANPLRRWHCARDYTRLSTAGYALG
jgi:hypothetical protein